jgi:hypothetical protein
MNIPEFVPMICLFCGLPLQGPEDAEYSSGDLIECTECGEHNDYDSVLQVAKEKGMEHIKKAFEEQIHREFKDLFKGTS